MSQVCYKLAEKTAVKRIRVPVAEIFSVCFLRFSETLSSPVARSSIELQPHVEHSYTKLTSLTRPLQLLDLSSLSPVYPPGGGLTSRFCRENCG